MILGLAPPSGTEDLNRDGTVNVVDLQLLVTVALGMTSCPA